MAMIAGFTRREGKALGLIGFAHVLSHVYQLAWAPLLPLVAKDLSISYVEFGLAIAVYAACTGLFQTPMGLLVERVGGRVVLIGGLGLGALCFTLIGFFATSYWQFLLLMALSGIGNSVFHPADYALLSTSIDEKRIGKAYAAHNFLGHIGFIAGPIITAALEPVMGWRMAIVAIGLVGIIWALVLAGFAHLLPDERDAGRTRTKTTRILDLLSSPVVLLFFLFYALTSFSNIGITQFSVVALGSIYGVDRVTAVFALTAYQVGVLLLILPGGVLADRSARYDLVIAAGFLGTAVCLLIAGTALLPYWLTAVVLCAAGALRGGVESSRDVAVRHIATHIPIGTVFGFVSTGFLFGQATGGLFFGWLFDNYPAHYIFYISALVHVLAISAVMIKPTGRRQATHS